ncbi:unnamed protein product [Trifolium pratense]|uniref:Uncharacterized protein n=1 Tax=Trifolium pratense TaxID=57577 RepID=A0ACB0LR53_TRIPR|nr:unnamed protein product [Trifolium pratense]
MVFKHISENLIQCNHVVGLKLLFSSKLLSATIIANQTYTLITVKYVFSFVLVVLYLIFCWGECVSGSHHLRWF